MCEDLPTLYQRKQVKVRKDHRCCECHQTIKKGELCEKVDMLLDDRFSSLYTCGCCVDVRDKVLNHLELEDFCHAELNDLIFQELVDDSDREIAKGRYSPIATTVDWLIRKNGRFEVI